ncbi:hypothetical protein [Paracidovorax citrulli]
MPSDPHDNNGAVPRDRRAGCSPQDSTYRCDATVGRAMPLADPGLLQPNPSTCHDSAQDPVPPRPPRLSDALAEAGAAARIALVVEHETGGIAGDYDEGISGLWQFLRYLGKAIRHSPAEVARALAEEAQNLQSNPAGALRDELLPVGRIEWGLAAFSTPLMLVLGVMAMTGGCSEMRAATQRLDELRAREHAARQASDAVRQLREEHQADHALGADANAPAGVPGERSVSSRPVLEQLESVAQQKLKSVRFMRRIERLNIGVGVGSFVSGAGIVGKVLLDTAYQFALAVAAGGLNLALGVARSATLASIGGVIGGVGAFILSPLAALAATALGAVFVHQSRLVLRRFTRAARAVTVLFRALPENKAIPLGPYRDYVLRKLGKRGAVLRRFRNWNAVFLAGSTVCAAGALAKGAVAGAAMLGIGLGVLSGPVALAILLLMLTVGGLTMALGSHTFFFTLAKTRRYQDYERDGHAWIDRDLLALTNQFEPDRGFALRASLFAQLQRLEEQKDRLLADAASHSRTRYSGRGVKHDDTGMLRRTLRRIGAALLVPHDVCVGIVQGRGLANAWAKAELAHDHRCGDLTVAILTDAMDRGPTELQTKWMGETLSTQIALLQLTAHTRKDIAERLARDAGIPASTMPADLASPSLDAAEQSRLEGMLELKGALASGRSELADVRGRFLALQRGGDAQEASTRDLAHFCLREAPVLNATLRGSLLAAELELARAQKKARQRATAGGTPGATAWNVRR